MKKPKMIMFDYGNTLVYENVKDDERAFSGISKYIIRNDDNIAMDKFYGGFKKYKRDIFDRFHNVGFEAKYVDIFRVYSELYGIEFSKDWEEIEEIYFDDFAAANKMPMVEEFLNLLDAEGIRTAIISNISITSKNLKRRLDKLFKNKFEFVIATNDYIHRKPSKEIYEIAMAKANLEPEDIWYVGDNPVADIIGATEAKIFPILFDAPLENHFRWDHEYYMPDCDFIRVEGYDELIELFKNMEWE